MHITKQGKVANAMRTPEIRSVTSFELGSHVPESVARSDQYRAALIADTDIDGLGPMNIEGYENHVSHINGNKPSQVNGIGVDGDAR